MKKAINIVFYSLAGILLASLFVSCKTTKQITKETTKSDSTGFSVSHQVTVSTKDTLLISSKDSSFNTSINIEFAMEDTTGILKLGSDEDPEQRAVDLAGPKTTKKKKPQTINVNGNTITTDQPIKSVTINQGGQVKYWDFAGQSQTDSTVNTSANASEVEKDTTKEFKQVERKYFGLPLWLCVVIAAVLFTTYMVIAHKKIWFPFGVLHIDENETNPHA